MAVSKKIGGKPQNGWFISCKTPLKWMIWGFYPYFWMVYNGSKPYEQMDDFGGNTKMVPQNGWFISCKTLLKWMISGGGFPPIFGSTSILHIEISEWPYRWAWQSQTTLLWDWTSRGAQRGSTYFMGNQWLMWSLSKALFIGGGVALGGGTLDSHEYWNAGAKIKYCKDM